MTDQNIRKTSRASKSYCYITADLGLGKDVVIESSFHSGFIAKLKNLVPAQYRTWNGENKSWYVHPRYDDQVKELAKSCFKKVWLIEGAIVIDLHTGEIK